MAKRPSLSHVDARGRVTMVDVGAKAVTTREAIARGSISMSAEARRLIRSGAIKKGEAVATRGQCSLCHGANLEGLGPVPGIAGRSPSYTVRQLYDMKSGARTGSWSELMKRVVAPMTPDDMLNVAAYVASKAP